MKGRDLVLGTLPKGGTIAALLVDGRLEDMLVAPKAAGLSPGDITGARVARRMPKQNAAIVNLGGGRTGYLRDAGEIGEGERLMVQVSTFAEPGKAAPVSRRVLFKGRTVIHTPGAPGLNVSRRLKGWEGEAAVREAITAMIASLDPDAGAMTEEGGFIVRHAAQTVSAGTVAAEARALLNDRRVAEERAAAAEGDVAPGGSAWNLALRELTDPIPDRLLLDSAAASDFGRPDDRSRGFDAPLREIAEAFGKGDPLDHLGVWEELAKLASPEAPLPSGGFMAVETTRAMVTVDVNTGDRFSGGAALTANLEAARELPRQLRLRGLGGQIAVDFAPVAKKDRRRVEDALRTSFRRDPVETSLAGWTPLGNFEISRKRERRPLAEIDL